MKIFATSDTHFGHDKLVGFTGRPEDFSKRLLDSIRRSHGDLLIHCGDFCFGNDEAWAAAYEQAAQGFKKKILVRGNHDHKSDAWYMAHGFDFVCDTFRGKYFGRHLIFSHMPLDPKPNPWVTFFPTDMNVHGHLHGGASRSAPVGMYDPAYHYDVAPELHYCKIVDVENLARGQPPPDAEALARNALRPKLQNL